MVNSSSDETKKTGEEGEVQADTSSTTLKPNVAGLLCYLGGWITGIIFLVLEQKNKFVRFHALQSIIVFGTLTLASVVLGRIPIAGLYLSWSISVIGFVFWIILMVKANSGEVFKMPLAGNFAEKLTAESMGQPPVQTINKPEADTSKQEYFRTKYYSYGAKAGRVVGSAFSIAWSIVLLVFFNFYNQYIAYYEHQQGIGAGEWQRYTFITGDFNAWLPILNTTLAIIIIGRILTIIFDKYLLNQITQIILDIFGLATVVTLLVIYPFNFSTIPYPGVATGFQIGITVTLILFIVGISVGILVRFIQTLVNVVKGLY